MLRVNALKNTDLMLDEEIRSAKLYGVFTAKKAVTSRLIWPEREGYPGFSKNIPLKDIGQKALQTSSHEQVGKNPSVVLQAYPCVKEDCRGG